MVGDPDLGVRSRASKATATLKIFDNYLGLGATWTLARTILHLGWSDLDPLFELGFADAFSFVDSLGALLCTLVLVVARVED